MDPATVRAAPSLYPKTFAKTLEVSQGKTVAPDTSALAVRADIQLFPPKPFSQELNLVQIHPNNK